MQTDRLRDAWRTAGNRAVYPILLRARAMAFDWSCGDRYEPLEIVQRSWLFLLFLFQRLGRAGMSSREIEAAFIRAFPVALDEIHEPTGAERRERLARVFRLRALVRFALFFGLIEAAPLDTDDPLERHFGALSITPTPLLHDIARFRTTT